MSNTGALISPELSARVHWTIGAASNRDAASSVNLGIDLIAAIQAELESVFRRGVDVARKTTTAGGSGGSASNAPATSAFLGGSGG